MKYLIRTVETYRVGSENEAKELIESAKAEKHYSLSKYSSEYKCTKAKGEVVDNWYRVTLTKDFTAEKEPDATVNISYDRQEIGFKVETKDGEKVPWEE